MWCFGTRIAVANGESVCRRVGCTFFDGSPKLKNRCDETKNFHNRRGTRRIVRLDPVFWLCPSSGRRNDRRGRSATCGAALIFVLCTLLHLWDHKAWFRRPVGLLRRRKLTTTLLALSCVVLTVTGVWLLIDQPVGETLLLERWHGVGALLFQITGLIHIVGRLRVLGRGIKRVVSG